MCRIARGSASASRCGNSQEVIEEVSWRPHRWGSGAGPRWSARWETHFLRWGWRPAGRSPGQRRRRWGPSWGPSNLGVLGNVVRHNCELKGVVERKIKVSQYFWVKLRVAFLAKRL